MSHSVAHFKLFQKQYQKPMLELMAPFGRRPAGTAWPVQAAFEAIAHVMSCLQSNLAVEEAGLLD